MIAVINGAGDPDQLAALGAINDLATVVAEIRMLTSPRDTLYHA